MAPTKAIASACHMMVRLGNRATIGGMLPPLELMFKAQGFYLERKLQASMPADAPWLSVTTSPKGSYREEQVLSKLDSRGLSKR